MRSYTRHGGRRPGQPRSDNSTVAPLLALPRSQVQVADRAGGADKIYVFDFDPGDLGKKRFVAQRMQVSTDGSLVVVYSDSPIQELNGRRLRYERER